MEPMHSSHRNGELTLTVTRPGVVRVEFTGRAIASWVDDIAAAVAGEPSPVLVGIDATRQTGVEPGFWERFDAWLVRDASRLRAVRVSASSAMVDMGLSTLTPAARKLLTRETSVADLDAEVPTGTSGPSIVSSASAERVVVAGIQLDMGEWPVVLLRPPTTISDGDLSAFLDWFQAMRAKRPEPIALIQDLTAQQQMSTAQRKLITDRMRSGQTPYLGLGLVFSSPVLRGVLTAILWFKARDYPVKTFRTVEEGLAWARSLAAATSPCAGSAP
ncbi:MAG: hypothetical protein WCJ30_12845 [Deltaproteobacteria bacterium]